MSDNLPPLPLPQGINERYVDCTSSVGLIFHIIEAGRPAEADEKSRPLILLLHGYPELAFSWRKIMPSLANEGLGNYVVAVDQRGYGRTSGWDKSSFAQVDLSTFKLSNLVCDMVALVNALGYRGARCVIGHDFGAVSASMCALIRPDFFKSCVLMSHPFKGTPSLPFNTANTPDANPARDSTEKDDVHHALANLTPPRKHYKWYNSTEPAASDWARPKEGLQSFLRGYIHLKSGNWSRNNPQALQSWTAAELAKMPHYYIMPLHSTMPQAIADDMESEDKDATKSWLADDDLAVYVQEWSRTGFQGALNWYRVTTNPDYMRDLLVFAGKKIEVPTTFISGAADWGNFQEPGVIEKQSEVCSDFRGVHMVDGAGHWPQQEQPEQVSHYIVEFLGSLARG